MKTNFYIYAMEQQNIGNFLFNHYNILFTTFKLCNLQDKFFLLFIKLIHSIIVLMVLFGWLLPKKYLLWHITLCFIILYNLDIYKDNTIMNELIYKIIERVTTKNNNVISKNDILNASKLIPISVKTSKIILFITMVLSFIGYIYPQYSGNHLITLLNNNLKQTQCNDNILNDHLINSEFKINNIVTHQEVLINETNNDYPNIELLNKTNNIINSELINNETSVALDINNVDENMSIFDKIEPIKIQILNEKYQNRNLANPIESLESVSLNKKIDIIEPDYKLVTDKMKLKNSLKEFNDLLNE